MLARDVNANTLTNLTQNYDWDNRDFVAYIASHCVPFRERGYDKLVALGRSLEQKYQKYMSTLSEGSSDITHSNNITQLKIPQHPPPRPRSFKVTAFGRCHGSHPETKHNPGPSSSSSRPSSIPHRLKSVVQILKNFRYAFVPENTASEGYMTEKIVNSYLGHSVPIYYGPKESYGKMFR